MRAAGYAGEIVAVGDEPYEPYNRPPLSKAALASDVAHRDLAFRQRAVVQDVVWRLGESVTSVDIDARTAVLGSGESLGCDALVLATGVSPRRLRVPGPAARAEAGRHVVRTLDDTIALRAALAPGTRVLVVGAGFIGCEVAATARTLGCEVACVAIDAYPMVRPLGAQLAAELQRRHESKGVEFHLGTSVTEFLGDRHLTGAVLSDGTRLGADVVVEALGSRCNTGLLDGQGFDLADGVLADAALRPLRAGLPVDGVAIVGDMARFPNRRFDDGAWRVEHWSIPADTGRRAGAVLAAYLSGTGYGEVTGRDWTLLPSFWSDQYDVRLQSYGMPGLADPAGIHLLDGDLAGECVMGYFRDDDLMGVAGIGMPRVVSGYRDIVGRRDRLGIGTRQPTAAKPISSEASS
jgi:NADPH-dependent 2,4-dienoyl-CoA reductase/sulfur reductase-like enzyme